MGMLGVAFLFNSVTAIGRYQSMKMEFEKTKGIVIAMSKTADSSTLFPVVQFRTIDNQRMKVKARRDYSNLAVGDTLELYYDLVNPQDMHIPSWQDHIATAVFSFLGVLLLLPAFLLYWLPRQRQQKLQRLKQNGKKLIANLVQIVPQNHRSIAGFVPYLLVCQTATPPHQSPQTFESPLIWANPTEYISQQTFEVFVNPQNPQDYAIDLSSLPTEIWY